MNVVPFPAKSDIQKWVGGYHDQLQGKSDKTVEAYVRAVRQFVEWLADKPGGAVGFRPELFTQTAVATYLQEMEELRLSVSHRSRVKSALSGFADWLIDEELLAKNPTRDVDIPPQPLLAPRVLTPDQRYILKNLVERDGTTRSEALFALGYWAGCRVSWLRMEDTQIGPKVGALRVGYKGNKQREIDILNEVRRPLYDYIHGERARSPFWPAAPMSSFRSGVNV
ncbi:tyrosine-type recombinase/integrase [Paenibacillus medicaginis]|uniref:Tyrosine-type recombinase/integrase n=1 Tax=Paenibacillus medicaginis TaxID=1470560 RepID=A0ABV5BWB3_9BACL